MKFGWLVVVPLLFATSVQARDAVRDEREIRRVEAAICEAFRTGDAAYLRTALDPRFTLVDSRGAITDLAQNLAEVQAREPRYEVFRNHDQQVRVYADAAIVTGITTIKGSAGGDAFAADFRFTDTWIRRGSQWILASSHASRLPSH